MFDRLIKVIGEDNLNKLKKAKVAVIGVGGVGGYVVETLIRNGIENIIIVDNDTVDKTNKNRQIIALNSSVNKNKTDVFEERILNINENVKVTKLNIFLTDDNKDELFKYDIDYLIDACDTISTKMMLIKECTHRNIEFISSMGTGNKMNPKKLEITKISKTNYDPIAKIIRKKIKEENIRVDFMVLSSTEECIKTGSSTPGSYSVVPNVAGILIADYIIKKIIDNNSNN